MSEYKVRTRDIVLDRVAFRKHHIALQRRMLRQSVSEMSGDMSDLYFTHCEKMLHLIEAEASNAVLVTSERFAISTRISATHY